MGLPLCRGLWSGRPGKGLFFCFQPGLSYIVRETVRKTSLQTKWHWEQPKPLPLFQVLLLCQWGGVYNPPPNLSGSGPRTHLPSRRSNHHQKSFDRRWWSEPQPGLRWGGLRGFAASPAFQRGDINPTAATYRAATFRSFLCSFLPSRFRMNIRSCHPIVFLLFCC